MTPQALRAFCVESFTYVSPSSREIPAESGGTGQETPRATRLGVEVDYR
jgi:hypothetical protein